MTFPQIYLIVSKLFAYIKRFTNLIQLPIRVFFFLIFLANKSKHYRLLHGISLECLFEQRVGIIRNSEIPE